MLPQLPPSKPWLAGAKAGLGADENNPRVQRMLAILRRHEIAPVSIEEQKEFFLLNDELILDHEAIHGRRIHPSGEIVESGPTPTREQLIAAIERIAATPKGQSES